MVQYFIFSDYIWYDISFFQIMAGLNMMMTDEEHEQMVVFDRDISVFKLNFLFKMFFDFVFVYMLNMK